MKQAIRFVFLVACLFAVSTSASEVNAGVSAPAHGARILLLYSYHPTFPTSPKVLAGVRSVLDADEAVIDIEYMDSKRLYDEKIRIRFLDLLRYKLAHRPRYDLVITADDNALDFLLEHGAQLLPDIPVVFLGVNNVDKALAQNRNPLFTGVVEASSFRETIALARRLQPERDRINIIVDGTPSGQADLHTVLALREDFPGVEFVVRSLTDMRWEMFAEGLRQLGARDLILLLSAYRDSTASGLSFDDSLALIKRNTSVPIYHLWEHGMGSGVLGGVLVSHHEQGRQAAIIAKQVLDGMPVSAIPVVSESPNVPMFDDRELRRFGIDRGLLPEGALIRFTEISALRLYQKELLLLGFLFSAMFLVTIYLSRQNARLVKVGNELRETSNLLRLLMNTLPDLVWLKDANGVYLSCNARLEALFGFSEHEIVGRTDFDLTDHQAASEFRRHDANAIAKGEATSNEELVTFVCDGHKELLETIKTPVFDDQGRLLGVLGIARDITERKQQEELIQHQANYDSLTELPNRLLAIDRLEQMLKEAVRRSTLVAVLFMDLDDFKKVNDSLGHEVGDQLLIQCALRLGSALRATDTLGRLGGDEFIVLLGGLADSSHAQQVVRHLLAQFAQPFDVGGRHLSITASIGIALCPTDGKSASELLRNSDAAMYHAKQNGRNNFAFFTEQLNRQVSRRLEMEQQLHGAMVRQEFCVNYQPQIDLTSNRVVGAEALLRWHSPALGQVPPPEFIAAAERSGMIAPIGEYVLHEALSACATWRKEFDEGFSIAVNLSPIQIRDTSLPKRLQGMLERYSVPAQALELEITEGVLMEGQQEVEECLKALLQLGVTIAMDDFGTGYSSLNYLRAYPFHVLKIDRSFIADIGVDESDRQLIRAAIAMAQGLNLQVVAEGIETPEQQEFLIALGCDYGQGYLFGKPMTEDRMHQYLLSRHKTPISGVS